MYLGVVWMYNVITQLAKCLILQRDETALHKASRKGNVQIVECLVNARANMSIPNKVRNCSKKQLTIL